MKFGVVVPSWGQFADPAAVRDLVVAAEDLGYDSAWFGDHIVVPEYAARLSRPEWLESLMCCMTALSVTTRLRVGTDVLVVPYRHPAMVAKMASTADLLSGGRFTLGAGIGFLRGEFEALGSPPYDERGAVTDEYLAVLRLLWRSEGPVTFHGRYVDFADLHCSPRPTQDPLPVWVGGNARKAVLRAARLGDGWHPLFPSPVRYAAARQEILAVRGPARAPFTFSYTSPHVEVLDEPVVGPIPSHGYTAGEALPDDVAGYLPEVPRDLDGRPMFRGDAAQVCGDVRALQAVGVENLVLRFWTGAPDVTVEDHVEQMRRFRETVAQEIVGSVRDSGSGRSKITPTDGQ